MHARRLLTGLALGTAVLAGTTTAPAQAAAPAGTAATPGGWTMSIGGPIRSCPAVTCGVVAPTEYGDKVYWTSSAPNPAGNRWYKVTRPKAGYIYCMNITEPC
ncbi:hypothetical protein [Streptomyces sp. NBC_01565]|uniref:hypothetical protein n=1 Tax=unclassified Streptomyces TaxID=2593676 RepID=UPI002254C040|nr:hypothetical protein [Streptomyces sp. NBC_01565]MCX4539464.1 hypothetical protein [Streptomyces sp. NBC_01565]